ncbi:hypothetical protein BLOT_000371 [Blomia tropicalis]|nr:hypothetical protein BLOT_000371 [Blomia tropicalis]
MVKIRIFCFFNFVFLWILGIGAQQMSPFYGYQTNNGIRESLLAINAFCDQTCSPLTGSALISQCFYNSVNQNELIIQILRACTANTGYIIHCSQNSLALLENCALQQSSSYYTVASSYTRSCLRESLAMGTLDCLRMRNPRLNRLLPLGSQTGGGALAILNSGLLGVG